MRAEDEDTGEEEVALASSEGVSMEQPVLDNWETITRLLVSFLIGTLIGLERERQQRPAGLRTHILVTLASCLFAMVSIYSAGDRYDPGRIAAQVVTGIGFLGAGTIMRYGSSVRGLTTAASLWMAAALGLAAGFGWYWAATVTTLLAFTALVLMKFIEDRLGRAQAPERLRVTVNAVQGKDPLPAILESVRAAGGEIRQVRFGPEALDDGLHLILNLSLPVGSSGKIIVRMIERLEGVRDAEVLE